jgi:hypothetical protein
VYIKSLLIVLKMHDSATSGAGTVILPERMSSPPLLSVVRVTRSLVLYVCFVDGCLSFCTLSFDQCVVCSSSMYGS